MRKIGLCELYGHAKHAATRNMVAGSSLNPCGLIALDKSNAAVFTVIYLRSAGSETRAQTSRGFVKKFCSSTSNVSRCSSIAIDQPSNIRALRW
ncbi:unnamed protein product [Cuscuta campestris]|uniref:Uncharacterized protein n=1 Tax=Cuscuta campestris TaxID=132261 RepID=A0A484MAF6_9ASTE|nr:unnamed protein product [Cuscuta campestris]